MRKIVTLTLLTLWHSLVALIATAYLALDLLQTEPRLVPPITVAVSVGLVLSLFLLVAWLTFYKAMLQEEEVGR